MFTSNLPLWPRYRPIRIIGQGGFGTVYLCEDTEPTSAMYRQNVAVKAISLSALSDEEALMVMSEVSLLKNIDHPNIIKYYDSFLYDEEEGEERRGDGGIGSGSSNNSTGGEEQQRQRATTPGVTAQWLCLVTEYMDGGDLASLLQRYAKPAMTQTKKDQASYNGCGDISTAVKGVSPTTSPSIVTDGKKSKRSFDSPSQHLLKDPFSEEVFQWDSLGEGEEAADRSPSKPLSKDHGSPSSSAWRGTGAAAAAVTSLAAPQHERGWSEEECEKEEQGGASRGEGEEGEVDDWERLSSQHRQRLASTLRHATHPLHSHSGRAATMQDTGGVHTASSTTAELTTSHGLMRGAALDLWVSDSSAAVVPATPLGATELDAFPPFDPAADPLQYSPFPLLSRSEAARTAATETGEGGARDSALSTSSTTLVAQLPPSPNQLWVESFLITDIAKQCLEALAYLHALGIIHRDIKPSNIYLSKQDGTVKIGDFGVSKLLQPSVPFTTTFVGTPFYLCPELCMGDPYSFGADVWALGVLLYELYCLKLPFAADNVLGQIYVITEGTYDRVALRRPHAFAAGQRTVLEGLYGPAFAQSEVLLHGLVVEMVEQMLCVDPAQRPSAEALLTRVFGGVGVSLSRAGSSAGTSIAATPLRRPPSAGLAPLPTPNDTGLNGVRGSSRSGPIAGEGGTAATATVEGRKGSRDANRSGGEGERGAAAGSQATCRLGPQAAGQHARWAGSLTPATSTVCSHGSSRRPACEGNLPGSTATTSVPSSWLSSSPQPTLANSRHISTATLAVKVQRSVLDLLQEMPREQRARLESRAAAEDAYEAQRLGSLTVLSSPRSAGDVAAQKINLEELPPSSLHGSFIVDTEAPSLLPPTALSTITSVLYGGDDTAATPRNLYVQPPPLWSHASMLEFTRGIDAALRKGEDDVAMATTTHFSTLSKTDVEDSLDCLIGADTRGELDALLDEVPWLHNADVFSAIPLSAGSDDVMLVARTMHQGPLPLRCSHSPNRSTGSSVVSGVRAGRVPNTSMGDASNTATCEQQQQQQQPHAVGKCRHPPATAVHYAGSVPRCNPNITITTMPQGGQQRQRTSIACVPRADDTGAGLPHEAEAAAAAAVASSSPLHDSSLRRPGGTPEGDEGNREQRRLSRGSTDPGPGPVIGPPSRHARPSVSAEDGVSGSSTSKRSAPRRQRVSMTAVAVTAAIAVPLLAGSAGGSDRGNRSNTATTTTPQQEETTTAMKGAATEASEEGERPAVVTVVSARGGCDGIQGDRRSLLSSTKLLREGTAAGARLRPASAGHHNTTRPENSNGGNNSKGSAVVFPHKTKRDVGAVETPVSSLSHEVLNERDGQGGFPVAPLPATPEVRTAGRCAGLPTSELEQLLRAKLLAHYRRRQQLLRAQRAELAAQEAARVRMRAKLGAIFTSAYNARAGSTSPPESLDETASYHSTRTDDTPDAGERPRPPTRVATLPPMPGNSPTTSSAFPSVPLQQQQQQQGLAQPPRPPPPRVSARAPSSTTIITTTTSTKAASPVLYGSPDASSLDHTARQAAREEAVLRALSGRHTSDTMGGCNTPAGCGSTAVVSFASRTPSKEETVPPASAGSTSASKKAVEPDLLSGTQAVRELRQAATLAAAVERQKALLRQGGGDGPSRIVVAPPWRPPHDSRDVPGLWETSSAEGETEEAARGRPGRPVPAHLREELRWRWSAPPTDADSSGDDDDVEEMDEEAETSTASEPSSMSSPEWLWQEDAESKDGKSKAQGKTKRRVAAGRAQAPTSSTPDVKVGEGDGELQLQSSLIGSPMELRPKDRVTHNFLRQPASHDTEERLAESPPSEGRSPHHSDASSDGSPDFHSNGNISNSSGSVGNGCPRRVAKQRRRQDKKINDGGKGRQRNDSPVVFSSTDISSSRSDLYDDSSSDPSSSDPSSSSSSSGGDNDDDDESDEDMHYAFTVQLDADTGCRYFDYICPLTIELVGELPAACRVVTCVQMMTELTSTSPSRAALPSTSASEGLTDPFVPSSSPPTLPRAAAVTAPSLQEEREKQQQQPFSFPMCATADTNVHRSDDVHSSLDSSGKSSLFKECSLLLLNTPTQPLSAAEGAGKDSASKAATDGNPDEPHTVALHHSSYVGNATRSTQRAKGKEDTRNAASDDGPSSQRRVESMLIVGTKVLAATPSAPATSSDAQAGGRPHKSRRRSSATPLHRSRRLSRDAAVDGGAGEGGGGGGGVWRVHVPPPSAPPAEVRRAVGSAGGAYTYIRLPLFLALRPMRVRTRFVGLLWRLWMATQLADPALRRVILGSDRCKGVGDICTFAEAFGDWVRPFRTEEDSVTGMTASLTATASSANADAANSASASLQLKTTQNISSTKLEPPLPPSALANVRGAGARSADHPAEATSSAGAAANTGVSPRRRWTLYYVEPRLNVAVQLQSDADWAVVRHKVRVVGQLLPFIRLHMVLHEAEFTVLG
jgi:serine/threonine protein kinase